jgi:salicylate hydroxylase
MMPDQSQGACQSIEDAAALGIVFGRENFEGDVREALEVFEEVRKPRATKVQAASARARENINERIGMCPVSPQRNVTLKSFVDQDQCRIL